MKPAEDWVKLPEFQLNETVSDVALTRIIQQIQRDAWIQGLIDSVSYLKNEVDLQLKQMEHFGENVPPNQSAASGLT